MFILLALVISWVTLSAVVKNSKRNLLALCIHLAIQLSYSAFYYYNYMYNSSGGTALVWEFLWIVVTGIHIAIMLGILVYLRFKKNRTSND